MCYSVKYGGKSPHLSVLTEETLGYLSGFRDDSFLPWHVLVAHEDAAPSTMTVSMQLLPEVA